VTSSTHLQQHHNCHFWYHKFLTDCSV
jgi:hypothetical protein